MRHFCNGCNKEFTRANHARRHLNTCKDSGSAVVTCANNEVPRLDQRHVEMDEDEEKHDPDPRQQEFVLPVMPMRLSRGSEEALLLYGFRYVKHNTLEHLKTMSAVLTDSEQAVEKINRVVTKLVGSPDTKEFVLCDKCSTPYT